MRNRNPLNLRKSLPCMSWSPKNLYNLWRRTVGPEAEQLTFRTTSGETLFQQRWRSKAAVRAYHGEYIPEKVFKRWYLPDTIPDVRPRRQVFGDDKNELEEYAKRRTKAKEKERKLEEEIEKKGLPPVGSLMFAEVERRLDVFLFRCCFVHSVYEARRLIIHGYVKLNGKKHSDAFTRLAPGDMVSVEPTAIRFLKRPHGAVDHIFGPGVKKSKTKQETKPKENVDQTAENSDSTETVEPVVNDPTLENTETQETKDATDTVQLNATLENTETQEATTNAQATEDSTPETKEGSESTEQSKIATSPDTDSTDTSGPRKKSEPTPFHLPFYASPWLFIPAYIEVSFKTCSAVYVRHPSARPGYSEIPTPYDADGAVIRYAWEWYVQRRPRMRSQSQQARAPRDRIVELEQSLHKDRRVFKFSKDAYEHSKSEWRQTPPTGFNAAAWLETGANRQWVRYWADKEKKRNRA